MSSRPIVMFDVDRCVGCRSCEIACAIEHSTSKNLYSAVFEYPPPKPRIKVFKIDNVNIPLTCRHCDDPPCVSICPTGAMYRTDVGYVIQNPSRCIGCRLCTLVCPIAHPRLVPELRVVIKCDMCLDRVRSGRKPACVEACPTGALMLVTEVELAKLRIERLLGKIIAERGLR